MQIRSRPEWHCHGGGTGGEGPACVTLDDDDDDDDDGDDDDDDAVDDGGGGDHGGRTLLSSATFQNAAISKLESKLKSNLDLNSV